MLFVHHVLTRDRSDVASRILDFDFDFDSDFDFGDEGGGAGGDVGSWFWSSLPEVGG